MWGKYSSPCVKWAGFLVSGRDPRFKLRRCPPPPGPGGAAADGAPPFSEDVPAAAGRARAAGCLRPALSEPEVPAGGWAPRRPSVDAGLVIDGDLSDGLSSTASHVFTFSTQKVGDSATVTRQIC